jgi:predicted DNA-binding protein with PD1-like motif
VRKTRNGPCWLLRLEPGEEIVTALCGFLRRQKVKSGFLTGIGAARDVVLGHFAASTREYRKRTFRGEFEIAALVGNTAWDGKEPICHIHAVIAGPDFRAQAGHLFAGTVTVTCEIALATGTSRVRRVVDAASGLRLLDLP